MKLSNSYLGLFNLNEDNRRKVLAENIQKNSAKDMSIKEIEGTIDNNFDLEKSKRQLKAIKKEREENAKIEAKNKKEKEEKELEAIYAGKTYKREVERKRKQERTIMIDNKIELEIRAVRDEMFSDIYRQLDLIIYIKAWFIPGLRLLSKHKSKNHTMKDILKEAMETVNFDRGLHSDQIKSVKRSSVKDEVGVAFEDVRNYATEIFRRLAKKHVKTKDDLYTIALVWIVEGMVQLRRHRISEGQISSLVLGFTNEI